MEEDIDESLRRFVGDGELPTPLMVMMAMTVAHLRDAVVAASEAINWMEAMDKVLPGAPGLEEMRSASKAMVGWQDTFADSLRQFSQLGAERIRGSHS